MFDFVIKAWNAWAPEMTGFEEWRQQHCQQAPAQTAKAVLPSAVPKIMQRRLSSLARGVFYAAEGCSENHKTLPMVFSSAHGDANKSLQHLQDIQNGEEVSPTAFSLSVHNAIAGLFSIVYEIHQEITVIAPGQDGIAPVFIEALGILQEHAEVLMVFYDEPLANFYPTSPFLLDAPGSCALAMRVSLKGDGLALRFSRSTDQRADGEHALQVFAFLNFLIADANTLHLGNHRHSWLWRKQAGSGFFCSPSGHKCAAG